MARTMRRYQKNFQYRKDRGRSFRKVLLFFVLLCVLVALLDALALSSYRLGSRSMEPTFPQGARVLASPLLLGDSIPLIAKKISAIREPQRGDVVVVTPPQVEPDPWYLRILDGVVRFFTLQWVSLDTTGKRAWENREVIKRVIAIPGDRVRMRGFKAEIHPSQEEGFLSETVLMSGIPLQYPELPPGWDGEHPFSGNREELLLKEGEYFLLGDNRGVGMDSLYLGPVDRQRVHQRVFFRFWPWPPIFL